MEREFQIKLGYFLVQYPCNIDSGIVVEVAEEHVTKNHDGTVFEILPPGTKFYVLNGQVDFPEDVWLGVKGKRPRRLVWDAADFWNTFKPTQEIHSLTHQDF